MAFISFQNETQKEKVLSANKHSIQERVLSFIQRGLTPNISDEDLSWNGQKLFVEEAPEPNAIDWEFIHISTIDKLLGRGKALIKTIVFEICCFFFVYLISLNLAIQVDEAYSQ